MKYLIFLVLSIFTFNYTIGQKNVVNFNQDSVFHELIKDLPKKAQ